jgi:uncharacterized OB-fold protein
VPDERSAPFWEATARHELTVARCSACSTLSLPPEPVCAHCGSTDPGFTFVPVSGRGVIRSWTVVRQSFLSGFDEDLPFVLVDVEIEEQADLRLIGRLVDGSDAPLHLDAAVEVAWEDLPADEHGDAVAVPAFRLRP